MPPSDRPTPTKQQSLILLGLLAGAAGLFYLATRRSKHSREFETNPEKPLELVANANPGDLLLFYDGWGIDKLICKVTDSPYYHVALYAGDNQVVEATTPGVIRKDLYGRKEAFVVASAPHGRGREALEWAETQIGFGYDPMSIADIVLDRVCKVVRFNYTSDDCYSCGEFVATAFDRAGVRLFPERELSETTPGDFASFLPMG